MVCKYAAIKVGGKKHDLHRYLMEQHLGRKLTRDEIVHHIDGDPRNNDLNNLKVMLRKDHSREHMMETGIGELARQKARERNAKLTEEEAMTIIQFCKTTLTDTEIARLFCKDGRQIHRTAVQKIRAGVNWKHLPRETVLTNI